VVTFCAIFQLSFLGGKRLGVTLKYQIEF